MQWQEGFFYWCTPWKQCTTSSPKYVAFAKSVCPHNIFFSLNSRVKLKHFEKFQDTAEALTGKIKD